MKLNTVAVALVFGITSVQGGGLRRNLLNNRYPEVKPREGQKVTMPQNNDGMDMSTQHNPAEVPRTMPQNNEGIMSMGGMGSSYMIQDIPDSYSSSLDEDSYDGDLEEDEDYDAEFPYIDTIDVDAEEGMPDSFDGDYDLDEEEEFEDYPESFSEDYETDTNAEFEDYEPDIEI